MPKDVCVFLFLNTDTRFFSILSNNVNKETHVSGFKIFQTNKRKFSVRSFADRIVGKLFSSTQLKKFRGGGDETKFTERCANYNKSSKRNIVNNKCLCTVHPHDEEAVRNESPKNRYGYKRPMSFMNGPICLR